MNENHLQQIFNNYIDRFEEVNNTEHQEYYKWQIIKRFRSMMDEALTAEPDDLAAKLYAVKRLTYNLIDNYTQPFHGLSKYAEKEPETVRQMFLDLLSDDSGDVTVKQEKISDFLTRSHALRDKYYPDSYLYKDDVHSVTGYLFLYDPDHNYIYKATHALKFADCIEFYDDWGSGDGVRIPVYYRMCNQLVQAIKANDALMATDALRFTGAWGNDPSTMYPDPEKHILAFDLIYCCYTYGLFKGISFVRPKTKERQLIQERKTKAVELSAALKGARKKQADYNEAVSWLNGSYSVGATVRHAKYGTGIVTENTGTNITVDFDDAGTKKFGTILAAANGIITQDEADYTEFIAKYRDVLKKSSSITSAVSYAEKVFAPYAEYLD